MFVIKVFLGMFCEKEKKQVSFSQTPLYVQLFGGGCAVFVIGSKPKDSATCDISSGDHSCDATMSAP